MPGELDINVGGTWHAASPGGCAIKVAGVWRTIDSISVNVGGVWRAAYNQDATPPGPVTSPAGQFLSTTQILAVWHTPADADYHHVVVSFYQDNRSGPPTYYQSQTITGSPSQLQTTTYTGAFYDIPNISISMTTYDAVGNQGPTVVIPPQNFATMPPAAFSCSDGGSPFTQQVLNWNAPAVGYVNHYHVIQLLADGVTIVTQFDTYSQSATVNVNHDTDYLFNVFAVNGIGVSSGAIAGYRHIGHAGQGSYQPNYGWGADQTWTPPAYDATSVYSTNYLANSVDSNISTYWASAGRASDAGLQYWEGAQYGGFGTFCSGQPDLLFTGASVICDACQILYCGLADSGNTWLGSYTPGSMNLGNSGYPNNTVYNNILYHNYAMGNGDTSTNIKSFDFSGWGLKYQQLNLVMFALTYFPYFSGGWRARIHEVSFGYRVWEILSWTWVQTVAQENNYSY